MKKKNRVKKAQEFQAIIGNRCFESCKSVAVYVKERSEEEMRVGISVSKKMGHAVVRNKIKRQIRMMVHEILPLHDKLDYIILARAGFNEQSYQENKKDLERCIKKVKIRVCMRQNEEIKNEKV